MRRAQGDTPNSNCAYTGSNQTGTTIGAGPPSRRFGMTRKRSRGNRRADASCSTRGPASVLWSSASRATGIRLASSWATAGRRTGCSWRTPARQRRADASCKKPRNAVRALRRLQYPPRCCAVLLAAYRAIEPRQARGAAGDAAPLPAKRAVRADRRAANSLLRDDLDLRRRRPQVIRVERHEEVRPGRVTLHGAAVQAGGPFASAAIRWLPTH
jgi:hypothetical protein